MSPKFRSMWDSRRNEAVSSDVNGLAKVVTEWAAEVEKLA